jgi:hypothetical protein
MTTNLYMSCEYNNRLGHRELTSLVLNTNRLCFVKVNNIVIFAIRESRINNVAYEET